MTAAARDDRSAPVTFDAAETWATIDWGRRVGRDRAVAWAGPPATGYR